MSTPLPKVELMRFNQETGKGWSWATRFDSHEEAKEFTKTQMKGQLYQYRGCWYAGGVDLSSNGKKRWH